MIDVKPYLEEIRIKLIDVLKAHPCGASYAALGRLDSAESLEEAFPEIASLGKERLKTDSYTNTRNARYKKKMSIVDEMRLSIYEIPGRMFEDEKALTGVRAVDGRASSIVRPAAQIAAVVASKAMFEWMKLGDGGRVFWGEMIAASGN